MKTLLTLIFCLLGVVGHAATPAFSGFYGSNGVTVLTNPVTGKIIISGGGSGTATNLASGTNSVYFTNECYVTVNQNSNILIVTGFGTAGVNGTYHRRTGTTYTNTVGVFGVYDTGAFEGYTFTNSSGTSLYENFDAGGTVTNQGYVASGGAEPPGLVIYGPNTNCFTALVSSAPLVSGSESNIYVTLWGNDTNGGRGLSRPFRNLQPALLAANRRPDYVIVDTGAYPELASMGSQFYVSNRVSIIGQGPGSTIIGTEGGVEQAMQCGGVVLDGFTFYGQVVLGGVGVTATNAILKNLHVFGNSDGVYLSDWETQYTIEQCFIDATYDAVADWESTPGGSNRVGRIRNSYLRVDNSDNLGTLHGFSGNDNRVEFDNCTIEVRDGHVHNFPIYLSVDTQRTNKTGSVVARNTAFISKPTNQVARFTTNFNNLPIFLDNCTMEAVRGNLVSGTYTQQWSDRVIDIPNGSVRSNRVMTLTSLTNALVNATQIGHRFTINDAGGTAFGTNIWIVGPFVNGPTVTNIANDWGSMTIEVMTNNVLRIIAAYP